jgi:UDP-N-acetylglucosamine 1-carboxyvinyltransferase
MNSEYILIDQSLGLRGQAELTGAKNSVLVVMASLILAPGKSRLFNVPCLDDVHQMIALLKSLGAVIQFDQVNNILDIDTSTIITMQVSADIMKKMRASILVMGPLLARFKRAQVALPGGCILGARPIDFHLKAFGKMGAEITFSGDFINAQAQDLKPGKFILEYPSVGATENIMMAAVLTPGITKIVNAAIEPEVLDLIDVLKKMGAHITIQAPATIEISGVSELKPIEHTIMYDRLEAGSLILATAITGGELYLPHAPIDFMEVFLTKLEDMGHTITVGPDGQGIIFKATKNPVAVSFKTMPYPGFPTDLQAPMMAALCLASGTSVVQETVYENRLLHVRELQKMGAQISIEGDTARIKGVDQLYGAHVIATDIRASCALLLAGLAAQGQTHMTGVHHVRRGYQGIVEKINMLGGKVAIKSDAL